MKKNYYFGIIIPLFLISLNASSQATTKIQQRLDSSYVYTYSSSTDSTLVAQYAYWYYPDGSDSLKVNTGLYVYSNKWDTLSVHRVYKDQYGRDTAILDYGEDKMKYKTVLTYNAQNILDSRAVYFWNSGDQEWIGESKIEFSFDSIANDSVQYESDWSYTNKTWIPYKFHRIKTNANGNRERITDYYSYGEDNNVIAFKTEYFYDNYNRDTCSVYCTTKNNDFLSWYHMKKDHRKYDINGNVIDWQVFGYQSQYDYWYLASHYTYTYQDNKLMQESTFGRQVGDSIGIKQTEVNRKVNEYDANGVLYKQSVYDMDNSGVLKLTANTYFYHSLGNVLVPEVEKPILDIPPTEPLPMLIVQKMLCDSIASYEYQSNVDSTLYQAKRISYDSLGNRTTIVYDFEDGVSSIASKKYEMLDTAGNVISIENYVWNEERKKWEGTSKGVMKYDSNHALTMHSYSEMENGAYTWVERNKFETLFDSLNRITSVNEYTWNDYYENATKTYSRTYSYNPDGTLGQIQIEIFATKTLQNGSLITYTYATHSNDYTEYLSAWNIESQTFVYTEKREHTMNSKNPFETVKQYFYDNNSKTWNGTGKKDYYRDEMGRDTAVISSSPIGPDSWYSYLKTIYTYDQNGNTILEANLLFNGSNNTWFGNTKIERTFTNTNVLLSTNEYTFDFSNNVWIFNKGNESSYDSKNRLESQSTKFWNTNDLTVSTGYKTNYNYRTDDSLNIVENYYYADGQGLVLGSKDFYYFSSHDVKIIDTTTTSSDPILPITHTSIQPSETESAAIVVYPNPTSDYVNIVCDSEQFSTITFFSMQGKKAFTVPVEETVTTIPLGQLQSGIWIVKIEGSTSVLERFFQLSIVR